MGSINESPEVGDELSEEAFKEANLCGKIKLITK